MKSLIKPWFIPEISLKCCGLRSAPLWRPWYWGQVTEVPVLWCLCQQRQSTDKRFMIGTKVSEERQRFMVLEHWCHAMYPSDWGEELPASSACSHRTWHTLGSGRLLPGVLASKASPQTTSLQTKKHLQSLFASFSPSVPIINLSNMLSGILPAIKNSEPPMYHQEWFMRSKVNICKSYPTSQELVTGVGSVRYAGWSFHSVLWT